MKEINPIPARDLRPKGATIEYDASHDKMIVRMPRIAGQIGPTTLLDASGRPSDISPGRDSRPGDERWRDVDQALRHFNHVARVFQE